MNEVRAMNYSLLEAAHAIELQFDEALQPLDLSGPKFAALSRMVETNKPISLHELAAKLSCVRSNITQLIDRLEKQGLVRRLDDPCDRRGVLAEVTSLGRDCYEKGLKATDRVHQKIAKKLSKKDRKELQRILDEIR
jgi:MarR family transcriptional regulator, transcriptional regulator for hemolysin